MSNTSVIAYSEKILLQVKMRKPVAELRQQLAQLSPDQLKKELAEDGSKKTFWINI